MAESSATLHEPLDQLSDSTLEHHRAIVSLMEELEAIDWYQQRIDACGDPGLRAILAHNRDEEKEHAAMALEWLRRRDAALDKWLRFYLFSEGPIAELEDAEADVGTEPEHGGSLGIGSLK